MAADSPSVASGLQPGGAGFSVLSAQRRRFAPPPEGATLSDEEKQADGRDFVRHRFQGWRPDGDGQEQTQGAGPAVPVGSQLTDEYLWQVLLDDGSWHDVQESWNVTLFAAVRDGMQVVTMVRPWVDHRDRLVGETYYVDFRNPSWVTQENVRTGRVRPLRAVQVVRPAFTHMPPPPSPAIPLPDRPSEHPTVPAGPAAQAVMP
jgi:hypothetical protein